MAHGEIARHAQTIFSSTRLTKIRNRKIRKIKRPKIFMRETLTFGLRDEASQVLATKLGIGDAISSSSAE
jgi:hypothetical protein